jgi:hypothetical protein
LRVWGAALALYLAGSVALILLSGWIRLSEDSLDFVYGMVYGLSASIVGMTALFPAGIHLFQTDRQGGSGALMSGGFIAAWSILPVPRESVTRGIYLHGLATGLAWVLFVLAFTVLRHLVLGSNFNVLEFFLPLALAAPAVAGLLTCTAVGDKVRGTIAIIALLCTVPAYIGGQVAGKAMGLAIGSGANLYIGITLLLLLGLIGGVPALVHLRRPTPNDSETRFQGSSGHA